MKFALKVGAGVVAALTLWLLLMAGSAWLLMVTVNFVLQLFDINSISYSVACAIVLAIGFIKEYISSRTEED